MVVVDFGGEKNGVLFELIIAVNVFVGDSTEGGYFVGGIVNDVFDDEAIWVKTEKLVIVTKGVFFDNPEIKAIRAKQGGEGVKMEVRLIIPET